MKTNGECSYCHGIFGKTAMKRHLDACPARKETEGENTKGHHFVLRVQGADEPGYWMYLSVPADATLGRLDQFLRDTWLECCGHLSAFRICGEDYLSSPENGERGMNVRVGRVLGVGMEFIHEYDFGSTTTLKLKVVAAGTGQKRAVEMMARNLPPDIRCVQCGKTATLVCCDCGDWLCDDCGKNHECGEEMLMPAVNSPRAGACAYFG